MSKNITEKNIKKTVEDTFGNSTNFVFLLGSAGTPKFQTESDIDIAVHWKKIPPFDEVRKIQGQLEEIFERSVDLVSLNETDLIFGRQVLETGRLLIRNEPGSLLQWKMDQLGRYPDFKMAREIIEKNILKRKRYV